MRTVQMTLDDELVTAVDQAAKTLKTTRSAFTRDALRLALHNLKDKRLEKQHHEGYRQHPVGEREFSIWEPEQDWGDE